MPKADYIPKKDGDLLALLTHLNDTLPDKKVVLNLTDDDITTLSTDASTFGAKLVAFQEVAAEYAEASTDKTASRAAVEGHVRAIVRRIKSATGYTEAIGQLLQIIGSEDSSDLTNAKPRLTAKTLPHGVEVSFLKGKSDGVRIYSQRDGESEFTFLALDTIAPYVDNRPLLVAGKPEQRRYKAIYVSHDDEVGQFSDEVVATAVP
jgi:hypothetical protein